MFSGKKIMELRYLILKHPSVVRCATAYQVQGRSQMLKHGLYRQQHTKSISWPQVLKFDTSIKSNSTAITTGSQMAFSKLLFKWPQSVSWVIKDWVSLRHKLRISLACDTLGDRKTCNNIKHLGMVPVVYVALNCVNCRKLCVCLQKSKVCYPCCHERNGWLGMHCYVDFLCRRLLGMDPG